jgi:hypothetical protein
MSEYRRRPHWRLPLPQGRRKGENVKLPVPSGAGFKIGRRCCAMARGTGKPCRNLAMIGSPTCNKHGGHIHAYRAEIARLGPHKVISLATGRSVPRKMLAKRGSEEGMPPGVPCPASPVARGLLLEAYENRAMALRIWLELARKYSS